MVILSDDNVIAPSTEREPKIGAKLSRALGGTEGGVH